MSVNLLLSSSNCSYSTLNTCFHMVWQNGNYYGKQAYSGGGGYGYAMAQNQDPSMYAAAAAYGASSNGYGNQ